jgi:hypothetical protein
MTAKNSWEICPKCNGSGDTPLDTEVLKSLPDEALDNFYKNKHDKCKVCKGEMIINSFTGRPPKK